MKSKSTRPEYLLEEIDSARLIAIPSVWAATLGLLDSSLGVKGAIAYIFMSQLKERILNEERDIKNVI